MRDLKSAALRLAQAINIDLDRDGCWATFTLPTHVVQGAVLAWDADGAVIKMLESTIWFIDADSVSSLRLEAA